jgi:hypothetical protein
MCSSRGALIFSSLNCQHLANEHGPEYDLHNQRRFEIQQFALNAGSSRVYFKPAEKTDNGVSQSEGSRRRKLIRRDRCSNRKKGEHFVGARVCAGP